MSPTPGRQFAVKGVVTEGGGGAVGGSCLSFGKKPFDWMTDAQWQMLLVSVLPHHIPLPPSHPFYHPSITFRLFFSPFCQTLASNFDWIQEILDRITKDSKEAFWRSVGETIAPELINISEGIGYKYSAIIFVCMHA